MGSFVKIAVLTGSVVLLLYLQVASVVKSLKMKFNGITLEILHQDYIRLGVILEAINMKSDNVDVDQTDINMFINGRFAGKLQNPAPQRIHGKHANELFFTVDILLSTIGKELMNVLKSGSDYRFDISIAGKIYVSNMPFPVPTIEVYSVTFDEILGKWNPTEK